MCLEKVLIGHKLKTFSVYIQERTIPEIYKFLILNHKSTDKLTLSELMNKHFLYFQILNCTLQFFINIWEFTSNIS